MTAVVGSLFAASGFLIGWAVGSAVAAKRLRQRRVSESMRQYDDLVRVLSRTARPNKGNK